MVTTLRVYFYYSIRNSLKGDKNTRVQVSKVKGNKIFFKKKIDFRRKIRHDQHDVKKVRRTEEEMIL